MALSSNMFGMGKVISDGSGGGFTRWMVFLTSQFLFGVALTNLYLGMRGVMRLGGFVASGGPYEIAHQAPGWIWIMPVSIFVGLISVFVSFGAGGKLGGPNLMALAWSALFTSLGWNFMEFGFSPPGGQGLSWGWIMWRCFYSHGPHSPVDHNPNRPQFASQTKAGRHGDRRGFEEPRLGIFIAAAAYCRGFGNLSGYPVF
jgi:hypothetical protein